MECASHQLDCLTNINQFLPLSLSLPISLSLFTSLYLYLSLFASSFFVLRSPFLSLSQPSRRSLFRSFCDHCLCTALRSLLDSTPAVERLPIPVALIVLPSDTPLSRYCLSWLPTTTILTTADPRAPLAMTMALCRPTPSTACPPPKAIRAAVLLLAPLSQTMIPTTPDTVRTRSLRTAGHIRSAEGETITISTQRTSRCNMPIRARTGCNSPPIIRRPSRPNNIRTQGGAAGGPAFSRRNSPG